MFVDIAVPPGAWDDMERSNCLDKQLDALFLDRYGKMLGRAVNLCAPPGFQYGESLPWCPREGMARGEGRHLCNGVHCEFLTMLNSRPSPHGELRKELLPLISWHNMTTNGIEEFLNLFTSKDRSVLWGGTILLRGARHACDVCRHGASALDIRVFIYDEKTGLWSDEDLS